MKKQNILLLIVTVVLFLSVCCILLFSPDDSADTFSGTIEEPGQKMELIMWAEQDGLDTFEQNCVDKYNQTSTTARIRVVSRPREVDTDTIASLMSGTAPDILILSDNEVITYANMGLLLPMDSYLSSWEELDGMNMEILNRYKIRGGYYGLPCGEYAMGLLYNRTLFKESGITPPKNWTWDEFLETAVRLTNAEKEQYGFALNWRQWGAWTFQMFAWAGGDDLSQIESNEKLDTTFTAPGVIKAAAFYRSLKQNKCIQPDSTKKLDTLKQDFAQGKAAMIYVGLDDLESFTSRGMALSNIGFLPLPVGPSGTNQTQLGGSCYVMTIGVEEQKRQAVFDYYSLLCSRKIIEDKEEYYLSENATYMGGEIRTDVSYTYPGELNGNMLNTIKSYQDNGRYSFYGYSVLTPFVEKAIEKIMTDETVDLEETFSYYEDEANRQAVKLYNNSIS